MIGIIAAIDEEMEAITVIMQQQKQQEISGIRMVTGMIEQKAVIVMQSGVGKVNAAMATTMLLEHFQIDAIINVGTAGGLKQDQQVLDAVLSTRVVQHDFDTSPVDGKEGVGLFFNADTRLIHACEEVLHTMGVRVSQGLIASGDQFVSEAAQRERIHTIFPDAICAEMEAGAIAQVCDHYHIPFVVLRSLSDVTHKEGSPMDFLTYAKHASKRSAMLCQGLMKRL